MVAKMRNGGEACTAANRFYVEASVAEEFSPRLAERMAALTVGPGIDAETQVGPLVNADTVDKVDELVQGAVAAGAAVVVGGTPAGAGRLLLRADRARRRARRTRRSSARRSSARWRRSSRSTTRTRRSGWPTTPSTAWSPTSTPATWPAGLRVERGAGVRAWSGSTAGLVSDPAAPFGGVKQSGIGREGGHEGMLDYTGERSTSRCSGECIPGARVRKLVDFHGMSAADIARSRMRRVRGRPRTR